MRYLDNAATGGKKPVSVRYAVLRSVSACANPGRSGHSRSLRCAQTVFCCRTLLSDFFGGYGEDRVVFTKNCTEALNLAILGVLQKGDHVVTTHYEHNSVLRPLESLREKGIIEYSVTTPEEIPQKIQGNTKAVIVTLASNVTGECIDVAPIRRAIPPHVLLICDGAQAGGHIPISMKRSGIDALALAGHKGLHAIQGSGALLFSDRTEISPVMYGGTGSESFRLEMPAFYPDRLEAGTISYPAIASLKAGILYLQKHFARDSRIIFRRTEETIAALKMLEEYEVFSEPTPCGIVAFRHKRFQSETVAEKLNDAGIAVRAGLHCAPLMHRYLSSADGGLVRASFAADNTACDVRKLISVLKKL